MWQRVVGRFCLVANFRLALPIAHVNSLDKGMEFVESHGFSDLGDHCRSGAREHLLHNPESAKQSD